MSFFIDWMSPASEVSLSSEAASDARVLTSLCKLDCKVAICCWVAAAADTDACPCCCWLACWAICWASRPGGWLRKPGSNSPAAMMAAAIRVMLASSGLPGGQGEKSLRPAGNTDEPDGFPGRAGLGDRRDRSRGWPAPWRDPRRPVRHDAQ